MKRKIIIGGAITLFVVATTINFNVRSEKNTLGDVFLANVEALADTEDSIGNDCYNSIENTAGHKVIYCGNACNYVSGSASMNSTKCK